MSADILQMSVYEPDRRPRRVEFHEHGDLCLARRRMEPGVNSFAQGRYVFVSLDLEGSDEVLVNLGRGDGDGGYPMVQTIDEAIAALTMLRDNLASRA